jgi:pilus assembly protein CpaC
MRQILWLALVLSAICLSPMQAQERSVTLVAGGTPATIDLTSGFTVTVYTDRPFANLVVGNTAVADVFPLTDRSLYVQGNATGATNVTLYDANKAVLGILILKVSIDYNDLNETIASAVPRSNIQVQMANGRVRLTGAVQNQADMDRALQVAKDYTSDPVINALRLSDPMQVKLEVRILEVSRNAGKALGINLTGSGITTSGSASSAVPFGSFVGNLLQVAGNDIDYVINTLETKGMARRLANPTLVTSNGVEANFVVGGEVPITGAVAGDNGTVAAQTDYREYGVRLNFKPTVESSGVISLQIRPEVSDIDTTVNVNGQPGFITRKADTTVALRDGQSFAIAGLLQVNNQRNLKQVPWIGQVPILGALFRSSAYQRNETDLVIVVTPYLVGAGASSGDIRATDARQPSDEVELFMLGMVESNSRMIRAFETGEGVMGAFGHMLDLEGN